MDISPNMTDYRKEFCGFSLTSPERFSFPLDVFDRWGDGLALYWTDGGTEMRYSFNDLKTLSSKGAAAFLKMGISSGDRVMVMLPNIPEWWEVMLALMRINAVPIPATTVLTSDEIGYRVKAAEIKGVICCVDDVAKVEAAALTAGKRPFIAVIGRSAGHIDYLKERDSAAQFAGERGMSDDVALIYFTSGTTGLPKMVAHTHASYPLAHMITGRYWLDLRPGDLHWNISDTGWAKAAWSSLFGPWNMGASVFSYFRKGRFDPSATLDILRKYPVTTFCGPPTAYRMMVKELPEGEVRLNPRHYVAAGEPLNKEIIKIWEERTGRQIYDGYGQTESVNLLANFRCIPSKPGSMGLPTPGFTVEVMGEDGNPAPAGSEGEIAVKVRPERPVGLFKEYLGNPEATANSFRGDWYLTGDRAYRDEDGYFWFVGRADDIMLTAGYRIGPFEVESVLIEHPAVKESAVVASPDEVRGEVVKAFIVLTRGYTPSDELVKEIQDFVKKHAAPYKYPRKIEFVEELPKTVSGKIKRKELKMSEFQKIRSS